MNSTVPTIEVDGRSRNKGRLSLVSREDCLFALWRDAGLRVRRGFAGAATGIFVALCAPVSAGESLSSETLLPVHEDKDAYFPAAACGPDHFLIAWQAGRIAEGALVWGKGEPVGVGDIVACRVDKAGKTLDAAPFVVSGAGDLQEKPRVAFGPSSPGGPDAAGKGVFLVVWQDLRNGKDYDVYAARVTPGGRALDQEGIRVAGGPHNQANPCVAYDGNTFLVAWQDFKSGKYAIRGARVSGEGQLLDAEGIVLGDSGRSDFHRFAPAAGSQGDGRTVVFWVSGSTRPGQGEPSGGCFVRDGKVEKSFQFKGHHYAAPVNPVAVAAGPKGFLVAWRNNVAVGRGTPSRNANAAFFGPEGEKEPSDEKGTRGAFRLAGSNIADPAIAWDGARFVAAWHEAKGEKKAFPSDVVRLATVSADGIPSGQALDVSGTRESPACGAAAASDGAGTTLIAYEKHPATSDVPVKVGFRILGTR